MWCLILGNSFTLFYIMLHFITGDVFRRANCYYHIARNVKYFFAVFLSSEFHAIIYKKCLSMSKEVKNCFKYIWCFTSLKVMVRSF